MKNRIKTLEIGKTCWDPVVTGLHVRSTKTKKSYMLYYRTKAGIERRPKIGEVSSITLQEARKRARILLDRVAVGEDPKGQWDQSKAEMSITELFKLVWADHWHKRRFIESGWAREVEKYFKKHIEPNFGSQKISAVSGGEVKKWHAKLSESPTSANRSLEVFSKMFKHAEENGQFPRGTNPCSGVKPYTEKKRGRFASKEEIKRIFDALASEERNAPLGAAFIKLLLFTGARPRALECVFRSGPSEIQFHASGVATHTARGKSTGETGEEETIVFSKAAVEILNSLPANSEIKMPRKLWNRVRKAAGCPDLWARDLRRTFATTALSSGVSIGTIGELLNHKSAQTTKVYAKLMHDAKLYAASQVSDSIAEIIKQAES